MDSNTKNYPTNPPRLLDYKGIKHYFGLSPSTLQKLVMKNKFISIVKVGTKNFFKTSDVETWIDNGGSK